MALARIYRPAKTAMQSGRGQTRKWVLEYEPASRRDPDPLMGWSSAHDTLNEVQLRFDTLEEALAYAKKYGLEYTVIEPHARTPRRRVTPIISATTGCAPDPACAFGIRLRPACDRSAPTTRPRSSAG